MSIMTKEDLKTIEQKALWELENNPSTRDSDRNLVTAVYMDFYGMTEVTPFVDVMYSRLPSYESIGRARRKIQETRRPERQGQNRKRTPQQSGSLYRLCNGSVVNNTECQKENGYGTQNQKLGRCSQCDV